MRSSQASEKGRHEGTDSDNLLRFYWDLDVQSDVGAKGDFWERDIEAGPWRMMGKVPGRAGRGMALQKTAWATAQKSW